MAEALGLQRLIGEVKNQPYHLLTKLMCHESDQLAKLQK
jgi:hypothetical protein